MSSKLVTRRNDERKAKPCTIARMAAIQKKIVQIDRRLSSLQFTGNLNETVGDVTPQEDMDSSVMHMLSVDLCQLAASGDAVGVRTLLNCGVDTDCRDYDEQTPLHIASALGHVHVVCLLLEFGADPALLDKTEKTPLKLAEENHHSDVVQLLLKHSEAHRQEIDTCSRSDSSLFDSPLTCGHRDFSRIPQPMMGTLIVIMVGLPGSGKTYIAKQIQRYFQWNGLPSSIFSRSSYEDNFEGESRISSALANDMTQFIAETDGVAVLDGTSCSPSSRRALMSAIKETERIPPNRVVFVEVVNNDPEILQLNVNHMKEMNPDVPETFVDDYYASIEQLKTVYKPLNPTADKDLTYIRIEDQVTYALNNISGWMPTRLFYMLHNLCHAPSNLYLTRAGEYVDLVAGRIGGNSRLTERGQAYSEALFEYFQQEVQLNKVTIMSSCALRCTETVQRFEEQSVLQQVGAVNPQSEALKLSCRVVYLPTLDNVNHGDCDGQLFSDVRRTMPGTLLQMQADPYHTAWPNGECIHQLYNARLEPHIHDIQASTEPVLVVSHLVLLQGLYSYFVSENDRFVAPQNAYQIEIPLESVIKIRRVGVNRIAEIIDLSKEVDKIERRRTGKVTKPTKHSELDIFYSTAKR
ncbi:6-phosphofructo-2-kinase/fructose-2,6-biphosphatase-1-like protein [Trypanosoma rangeli]|uniref:6-phosphofructo-2-kinase/fructose-2, 6-biphosphatase-1-like protein n=1 Tax=Trypanosoma rangeli TaxID=5698 RepID=A0A3R7MQ36_TRYRA|nr:6-phosphofructo-2-kinase/fructose-2,6-biphosphatase-1-like protein [Trypanosoma rangeli]RNF09451.1 6-phosphofructo-2-kinase/fructose-2,6-biphosphatase-1-like protein [Trypanosoma rangeli]|eukprot:RNF09451.1 6-phosphofructo-2-kinase/fructose-2,6-biphosphatase-1-like protein [Trypanosoma rangeli]